MNKKTYTAPEAEIELFSTDFSITTSDPDANGGLDYGDNIIDF